MCEQIPSGDVYEAILHYTILCYTILHFTTTSLASAQQWPPDAQRLLDELYEPSVRPKKASAI